MSILRRLARFLAELAGELADETAYKRHLAQCGRPHSGEEWRRFSDHRMREKYQRAKCC